MAVRLPERFVNYGNFQMSSRSLGIRRAFLGMKLNNRGKALFG